MSNFSHTRPGTKLVLENGQVFTGTEFGAVGQTLGGGVLHAMTSWESLTNPATTVLWCDRRRSRNTRWNDEDSETACRAVLCPTNRIWVARFAVHSLDDVSNAPRQPRRSARTAGRRQHPRHHSTRSAKLTRSA